MAVSEGLLTPFETASQFFFIKEELFMTVNHASTLNKEYFLSYINLIMISRNYSLEQAEELTMEIFFHNNIEEYGKQTYERFLAAINDLQMTLE
jgi:hypothetical protein